MTDDKRPESRPVGRPTLYAPELAAQVCERIVEGESLRSICRDESMPCASTICLWRTQHEEFSKQYALAKETRAELGFDDIQEVADNGSNDWMAANDPDNPGYRANGEHIQRSRLRVDTMKWRLARMNPKRYGDRTVLAGDPESPIAIDVENARERNLALLQSITGRMAGQPTTGTASAGAEPAESGGDA